MDCSRCLCDLTWPGYCIYHEWNLMLALHALFQLYQKRVHNIIYTLLFMNLLLINSIIGYHLYQVSTTAYFRAKKLSTKRWQNCCHTKFNVSDRFQITIWWWWLKAKRSFCDIETKETLTEILIPAAHKMRRLRTAVLSVSSISSIICLWQSTLIAGEVSYIYTQCFKYNYWLCSCKKQLWKQSQQRI